MTRRPTPTPRGLAGPAPASSDRPFEHAAWVVVAVLAAALLFMVFGPHRIGDNFAETDFYGGYADGARALQRGQVDPSRYGVVGPGYEAALALVGFAIPNLFLAAELLSWLALLAGLACWVLLLRRRVDARLALGAVLFLAVNPTLFRAGYSATNDALAFALQAGAMLALLTGRSWRAAAAAGLLTALAFLTRYNGAVLLPVGLAAILAGATAHGPRRPAALALIAGFLLPVAPWVIASLASGQSFAFQFHHNIAYDVFARARGIAWDDYQKLLQPQFPTLGHVIERDPGAVLNRELFNVVDHLRLDGVALLGLPVAVCAILGAVLGALDGTLRRLWPVALAAGLFFLTLVPVFYSERYGLPLLPFYATLAALAFTSPRFAFAVGRHRRLWLKSALAALPLLMSLRTTQAATRRMISQLPVEVLECATTLRAEARPGDQVICRKAHIAFHSGVKALAFPFTRSLPELAAYAREHGARWLYFSWPEAEMRPGFWYLLDTTAVVPGLTRRHAPVRPAVLYEIGPEFGREPEWFANDTLHTWHDARAHLRVDPGDPGALFALAYVEYGRGEYAVARRHLERSVQRGPRRVETWLLLGEIGLILEDPARARAAYQRALSIDAGNLEGQLGLGWSFLLARQVESAARVWRPLIGSTADPGTLERMADVYRALGDAAAEAQARQRLARLRSGG